MTKKTKKNRRSLSNRNAFIQVRPNFNAAVGAKTFTKGRDPESLKVSADTSSNNSTKVVITRDGGFERMELNGFEARTLQRLLNTHYNIVS